MSLPLTCSLRPSPCLRPGLQPMEIVCVTSSGVRQGPERESTLPRASQRVRAELGLNSNSQFSVLSTLPPGRACPGTEAADSWGSAPREALGAPQVPSCPSTTVYQLCGLEKVTQYPSAQSSVGATEVITDPPPDPPSVLAPRGRPGWPACQNQRGVAGEGGRGRQWSPALWGPGAPPNPECMGGVGGALGKPWPPPESWGPAACHPRPDHQVAPQALQPGRTRGCENSSFRKGGCVGARGGGWRAASATTSRFSLPLRSPPGPSGRTPCWTRSPVPGLAEGCLLLQPPPLPSPSPSPLPPPMVLSLGSSGVRARSWVSLRGASEGRSGGRSLGVWVTRMACGWGQWAGPARPSPMPPSLSCCRLGLLTCPRHIPSRTQEERPTRRPPFLLGPEPGVSLRVRGWCQGRGQSGAPQGLAQMAWTGLQTGPSRTGRGHGQGRADRVAAGEAKAGPSRRLRQTPSPGCGSPFRPAKPTSAREAVGRRWGDRAQPQLLAALPCSLLPCGVLGEAPAMRPAGGHRPWQGGPGRDRRFFSAHRWPETMRRVPSHRATFSSTLGFGLPTPASPGGCPPLPRTAPDLQPVWSPASLHPTSGHPLWGSPFCVDPPACPSAPHPLLQAWGPVDNLPAQGRPWRGCVSVSWTGAHPAPPPGAVSLLRRRLGVVLPSTGQWTRGAECHHHPPSCPTSAAVPARTAHSSSQSWDKRVCLLPAEQELAELAGAGLQRGKQRAGGQASPSLRS